jgi:hypothetical protein
LMMLISRKIECWQESNLPEDRMSPGLKFMVYLRGEDARACCPVCSYTLELHCPGLKVPCYFSLP